MRSPCTHTNRIFSPLDSSDQGLPTLCPYFRGPFSALLMANAPPQRARSLKDQRDVTTCGPSLLPPDHAAVPQDPRIPCLNACFQDLRQSFFGSFLPSVGCPQCVQPQRAKSRLSAGGRRRCRALGNAEWSDPMHAGRALVVQDNAGNGKRKRWAPDQSLHLHTCPRPPKYWGCAQTS